MRAFIESTCNCIRVVFSSLNTKLYVRNGCNNIMRLIKIVVVSITCSCITETYLKAAGKKVDCSTSKPQRIILRPYPAFKFDGSRSKY